jgi:hypothetical protein
VSEGLQRAMEAKLALTEVAFQSDDKLAAKNPARRLNLYLRGGSVIPVPLASSVICVVTQS